MNKSADRRSVDRRSPLYFRPSIHSSGGRATCSLLTAEQYEKLRRRVAAIDSLRRTARVHAECQRGSARNNAAHPRGNLTRRETHPPGAVIF
jgi:hypothetical protein